MLDKLDKEETNRLQTAVENLTDVVEMSLCRTAGNRIGEKIERFVDDLCRISGGRIRKVQAPQAADLQAPYFRLGSRGRANIIYAALPLGHQLAPFIKALETVSASPSPVATTGSTTEIMTLISEQCPRCPVTVEAGIVLAGRHPEVTFHILDAMQFPGMVKKHGIKSVPATIIDQRLVLVGTVSVDRLEELLEIRGTERFEIEVVRSLIDRGNLTEAASRLGDSAGRKTILSLLQAPDFAMRLSALAVFEKALENQPASVRPMTSRLLELLKHPDSRIRGDVADLLGKIGAPESIPSLELLAADPDPDVVEAAADAVAAIRENL